MGAEWFESAPLDDPLRYPGVVPPFSYLLHGRGRLERLTSLPSLDGLHPVVAVGSNASPAQLVRKFAPGVSTRVPVLRATVGKLRVLPSAHLNSHGYLPWAPSDAREDVAAQVYVTFLGDAQLGRLDETEPNYVRVALDPARHPVRLSCAEGPLPQADVYVSRHGVIADPRIVGDDIDAPLPPQRVLLDRLVSALPLGAGLRTADDLVAAVRSGRMTAATVTGLIKSHLRWTAGSDPC